MGKIASFMLALSLIACGSDNKKKSPDAKVFDDAPPDTAVACSTVTPVAPSFLDKDYSTAGMGVARWAAQETQMVEGNSLVYQYAFYQGIETSLTGTFDLSMGNQANYKDCALCLLAFEVDSSQNLVKIFYQKSGSLMTTADPVVDQHLAGSISNLVMQEVTIDGNTNTSTPVAGGACITFSDQTVDKIAAPDAWTCTAPKYQDGTTCDCACGTGDPDCDVDANSIVGCGNVTDRCFQGACVTPPTNDTCTTGTALTVNAVGGPTAGTTKGAKRDYSAGLDSNGCTPSLQDGPDVAYTVVLTAATQYTFTLATTDANFDPAIALVGTGAVDPTLCTAISRSMYSRTLFG